VRKFKADYKVGDLVVFANGTSATVVTIYDEGGVLVDYGRKLRKVMADEIRRPKQ
jgi:thiamine phosphate synthase YjbQ (UPF0047 family)